MKRGKIDASKSLKKQKDYQGSSRSGGNEEGKGEIKCRRQREEE